MLLLIRISCPQTESTIGCRFSTVGFRFQDLGFKTVTMISGTGIRLHGQRELAVPALDRYSSP